MNEIIPFSVNNFNLRKFVNFDPVTGSVCPYLLNKLLLWKLR